MKVKGKQKPKIQEKATELRSRISEPTAQQKPN